MGDEFHYSYAGIKSPVRRPAGWLCVFPQEYNAQNMMYEGIQRREQRCCAQHPIEVVDLYMVDIRAVT